MNFIILIPTKNRPDILMKTLNRTYDEQYNYVVSIEFQDIHKYFLVMKKYPKIHYFHIPNDKGIGFTRHMLVDYALNQKVNFVWFLDDNTIYNKEKVPDFLQTFVDNRNIYWMAGFQPIMDLYFDKPKKILFPTYTLADSCSLIKTHLLKEINFDINCKMIASVDFHIQVLLKYPNEKHIFIYKNFPYRKTRHDMGGNTKYKTKEHFKQLAQYYKQKYNSDFFYLVNRKGKLIHSIKWKQVFKEVLHQKYWRVKDEC